MAALSRGFRSLSDDTPGKDYAIFVRGVALRINGISSRTKYIRTSFLPDLPLIFDRRPPFLLFAIKLFLWKNDFMKTPSDPPQPVITIDKKTGLPLIACKQAATAQDEMTPDRVAEMLLTQEVEWQHAAN
jgi:hypothetical protein